MVGKRHATWLPLVAVLALASCGGERAPLAGEPAGVLLVTLDTTRADRLGAYGAPGARTPVFDRLAAEGVLFEQALAPAPITLPSHASLLTGVYPVAHGVRDNGVFALSPRAILLSEVLRRHGWRTGAFVASDVLGARFGLDQGFEVYRAPLLPAPNEPTRTERPADEVVDDAIAWLSELAPGERFFAWVHLYDAHAPYVPPEPWRSRLEDPYDGEIAFADSELGRLLDFLRETGRADGLLVAVTADHGESLGEHGERYHGNFLYQGAMRVPLVVSGDAVSRRGGTRIPRPVSNVDLVPTLLELAGCARAEMPDVRVPSLLGRDDPERSVLLEAYLPYYTHRWRAARGQVWRGHKWIDARPPELYDLENDARETRDLAGERPDLARAARERFHRELDAHPPLGWVSGREVDDGERARLEALGYAVGSVEGDPLDASLPDPRERIGDLDRLDRARAHVRAWGELQSAPPPATAWQRDEREREGRAHLEAARELLEEVRAQNPRDPELVRHLGTVLGALGDLDGAIELLERAVELSPADAFVRTNLATAYARSGRGEEGVRLLRGALAGAPEQTRFRQWIVTFLLGDGQLERASWWLREIERSLPPGEPPPAAVSEWVARARAALRAQGYEPSPGGALPEAEPRPRSAGR